MHAHRLYSKLTLEVMLSIAFGTALDIQNGKGGKIYKAAGDMFNLSGDGGVDVMTTVFASSKTNSHFMEVAEYLTPSPHTPCMQTYAAHLGILLMWVCTI